MLKAGRKYEEDVEALLRLASPVLSEAVVFDVIIDEDGADAVSVEGKLALRGVEDVFVEAMPP